MRIHKRLIVLTVVVAVVCFAIRIHAAETETPRSTNEPQSRRLDDTKAAEKEQLAQATLGLGCFSCAEAIFERLKGVKSVVVGYSGGNLKDPTDEQIGSGLTGHAEVAQLEYDPKIISYDDLLEVFWKIHDPTTLNRQGKYVGTQYRSVIFYHTDKQREVANRYKEKLNASHAFADPIVTEISAYSEFYPAAKSHQGFFRLNPEDEYCSLVIRPKVEEFEKVFADKVRPSQTGAATKP